MRNSTNVSKWPDVEGGIIINLPANSGDKEKGKILDKSAIIITNVMGSSDDREREKNEKNRAYSRDISLTKA